MQQKAMARVRQMQKNSDEILGRAQKDFESEKPKPKPQYNDAPVTTKVTNMPPIQALRSFLKRYQNSRKRKINRNSK